MPLYDYQCMDCGTTFEFRATIKEKEAGLDVACPKCNSHSVRQLLNTIPMLHSDNPVFDSGCFGHNNGSGCCG